MTVLSSAQAKQVFAHSNESLRVELMLPYLMNRLTNPVHATSEPLDTHPITLGSKEVHRLQIWGHRQPFPISSPSGMGPSVVSRVIVGSQDAVHQGLVYDTGHAIGDFKALCPIKAVAVMMQPQVDACACGLDEALTPNILLLKDCVTRVLKEDWSNIDPNSVAGFRLVALARGLLQGQLLDSCWSVFSPRRLADTHIYSVCTGTNGAITLRLNLVHSRSGGNRGELEIAQSNVSSFEKRSFSAQAIGAQVIVVLVSKTPQGNRHSEGFQLGKGHSLLKIHRKLVQIAKTGKHRVVISERGGGHEAQYHQ